MFLGLTGLSATPRLVTDIDTYQELLAIYRAIQATEFSTGAGWSNHNDTLRTAGAPQVIATGATAAVLNNSGTQTIDYKPISIASFYDPTANKFLGGRVGDYYLITTRFKAVPSANGSHLDMFLDLGPGGIIALQSIPFSKGTGTVQDMLLTFPVICTQAFLDNGAIPKVTAAHSTINIYEVKFDIVRVFSSGAPA